MQPGLGFLTLFSALTVGASSPPVEEPAGMGVLCLGTLIWIAEDVGKVCHSGKDADYQGRLAVYSTKFDAYVLRNTTWKAEGLAKFKDGQGIGQGDARHLCEDDAQLLYDGFKTMERLELGGNVEKLLSRDGPPSFGDCL